MATSEEEPRKKQLNFGMIDEEDLQKIRAANEKFIADVMNQGYSKLNNKEFMKDLITTFGPTIQKWVLGPLSWKDARLKARVDVGKRRFMVDINELLRKLMVEINAIVEDAVVKLLEQALREASERGEEFSE